MNKVDFKKRQSLGICSIQKLLFKPANTFILLTFYKSNILEVIDLAILLLIDQYALNQRVFFLFFKSFDRNMATLSSHSPEGFTVEPINRESITSKISKTRLLCMWSSQLQFYYTTGYKNTFYFYYLALQCNRNLGLQSASFDFH